MKGHYKTLPDTTRKKTFPEPRREPNQYKEPIGPHKPTTGERILTAVGDFNRAIAPHVESGRRVGGGIQRYAAERSAAINHNFGGSPANLGSHLMPRSSPGAMGANWMNMSFPGSGFNEPAPRRKGKRRRNRDDGGYLGMSLW